MAAGGDSDEVWRVYGAGGEPLGEVEEHECPGAGAGSGLSQRSSSCDRSLMNGTVRLTPAIRSRSTRRTRRSAPQSRSPVPTAARSPSSCLESKVTRRGFDGTTSPKLSVRQVVLDQVANTIAGGAGPENASHSLTHAAGLHHAWKPRSPTAFRAPATNAPARRRWLRVLRIWFHTVEGMRRAHPGPGEQFASGPQEADGRRGSGEMPRGVSAVGSPSRQLAESPVLIS